MGTLDDVYQEHQRLLDSLEQTETESVIPEIKQFIEHIGKKGATVSDPRERSHLRSIMRFWGSFVYDHTGEFPDVPLLLPATVGLEQVQAQEMIVSSLAAPQEKVPTTEECPRFGVYELLGEIGEGGFSKVYKALDTRSNRVVALKILHGEQLRAAEKLWPQLIAQEQLIKDLVHPNIVPIYAVGENQGIPYIAMKYVQAGSLADRLQEWYWTPSIREILNIILQTLKALAYIHSRGIVHRDVKPSNILLDFDNTVYLTDFSIAQILASVFGDMIVGTPEYLAPEAILHPEKVDESADVYSIGVTLFYLLEGKWPFTGDTPEEIMYRHVTEEVPNLSKDVPDPLRRLVLACLAKDPGNRPQVSELQEEIERLLKSVEEEVLDSQISSFTASPESRLREHPTTAALKPSAVSPPGPPPPPAVLICPQCGARQPFGAAFCDQCGAIFLEESPQKTKIVSERLLTPRHNTQVFENTHPVQERVVAILITKDGSKYYVMNRERVTIGRSQLNDIVIDDPSVSHQHALIVYDSSKERSPSFTVFDLASSNGVRVNGRTHIKCRLKHNDTIALGNIELVFKRLDK